MSQAIAIRNGHDTLVSKGGYIPTYDLAGIQNAGEMLFKSGFFADTKSAAQAIVKVMAGAELGIPPFAAMQGIHIIQGKPCLSAGVMAGKVKASGRYDFRVLQHDEQICEIAFYQHGEEIGRSSFTIADARKANTKNLQSFARNMLYARAMSNGVKWHCPDIFLGPVYVPEEMGATVDGDGNVIDLPDAPAPARIAPKTAQEAALDAYRPAQPQEPRPALVGEVVEDGESYATSPAWKAQMGNHIGWMKAKGLDETNADLSRYFLSDALERPVAHRSQLTPDEFKQANQTLARYQTGRIAAIIETFTEGPYEPGMDLDEPPFEEGALFPTPAPAPAGHGH